MHNSILEDIVKAFGAVKLLEYLTTAMRLICDNESTKHSITRLFANHWQAESLIGRSIGDLDLKGYGVLAEPEVEATQVRAGDAFLVLATDGLWDCLSNEAVISLIHDTVKEPTMCAQRLVTEAITRGSGACFQKQAMTADGHNQHSHAGCKMHKQRTQIRTSKAIVCSYICQESSGNKAFVALSARAKVLPDMIWKLAQNLQSFH